MFSFDSILAHAQKKSKKIPGNKMQILGKESQIVVKNFFYCGW